MARFDIIIHPDGVIEHIHDDAVTALTSQLGEAAITRASHVEPWDELTETQQRQILRKLTNATEHDMHNKWFDDRTPLTKQSMEPFGPFNTRAEALAFEHDWIEKNHLGFTDERTDVSGINPVS